MAQQLVSSRQGGGVPAPMGSDPINFEIIRELEKRFRGLTQLIKNFGIKYIFNYNLWKEMTLKGPNAEFGIRYGPEPTSYFIMPSGGSYEYRDRYYGTVVVENSVLTHIGNFPYDLKEIANGYDDIYNRKHGLKTRFDLPDTLCDAINDVIATGDRKSIDMVRMNTIIEILTIFDKYDNRQLTNHLNRL